MTLKEAIEILADISYQAYFHPGAKEFKALALGIEALKRWQERHDRCPDDINFLLPGETEEVFAP